MTSTPTCSSRQAAWPTRRRNSPWRYRIALALGLLAAAAPTLSQMPDAATKPFIMTADGEPNTYGTRWVTLIYDELFKRLGLPYKVENYTLARRAALVEEGIADGETSRVYSYGDTRPYLVRVEEPLIDLTFALFAANPAVRLEKIEDLRATDYLAEYRRGILLCENTLKQLVPADRLSDVATQQQGLKKLLAGRTDVYCDLAAYVRQELESPEFKNTANIRRVVTLGKSVPTYPYLHKKHAALAPRMAAAIKQMKAEGLIERYRLQVERELGWTP